MAPFLLSPFPSARLALPPLCSKSICHFAYGKHLGEVRFHPGWEEAGKAGELCAAPAAALDEAAGSLGMAPSCSFPLNCSALG